MTDERPVPPETSGRVLHWAARYDFMVWLFTLGRERRLRAKVLELARLTSGEAVLDVGCGTGTLAIAAAKRVGATGSVVGIDASREMIARSITKARRAHVPVVFMNDVAEALPFQRGQFDLVLAMIMLHHLPRETRQQSIREMRRVLRPGGRVLVVDFERSGGHGGHLLQHCGRHGHVAVDDVRTSLIENDMTIVESGPVGVQDLHFVLAKT